MVEYKVANPDDLVVCPYDDTHMVRFKKFQYHLVKCRKNYLGRDYCTCPFNARHEIPRAELRYHIANCTDKIKVEKDIIFECTKGSDTGEYFRGDISVPNYTHELQQACTENWDAEYPMYRPDIPDSRHDNQFKLMVSYKSRCRHPVSQSMVLSMNKGQPSAKVNKPGTVETPGMKLRNEPSDSSLLQKMMRVGVSKATVKDTDRILKTLARGMKVGSKKESEPAPLVGKARTDAHAQQQPVRSFGRGFIPSFPSAKLPNLDFMVPNVNRMSTGREEKMNHLQPDASKMESKPNDMRDHRIPTDQASDITEPSTTDDRPEQNDVRASE